MEEGWRPYKICPKRELCVGASLEVTENLVVVVLCGMKKDH